jgi:hypothetical protein
VDTKTHWEKVYTTNTPESVSWYRPHLEISLSLIERAAVRHSDSIIDIGGGESTFVDDLLFRGYKNLAVLDVSPTAIEVTKKRLGPLAGQVRWLVGNLLTIELEPRAYGLWHDRAVFHFLTTPAQRGGHVIVGTFGPQGPSVCSGLEVMRYDAKSLHGEFGGHFRLVEHSKELHQTPFGTTQQFLYCYCRLE